MLFCKDQGQEQSQDQDQDQKQEQGQDRDLMGQTSEFAMLFYKASTCKISTRTRTRTRIRAQGLVCKAL